MKLLKLKTNSGYSLLEVMAGMIVLSIGLLGLAPMLVMSIEGNEMSRDNTVAANLAKEQVEFFEGLNALPATPYQNVETGLGSASAYTRSTYLRGAATDSTIPVGVYQLDVQVSWVDNSSVQRNTRYSTFILEP